MLAVAGAVGLTLSAYANSLRNAFHFDDSHVIVSNLFIRDLENIPRFFTDALTFSALPANATYRPVVSLTLAIDYALAGGLNPFWFHVTQLALLLATGVLLYVLYHQLFVTASHTALARWIALCAATFFCVHTGNTQTVNYISARSELLSGIGVLGAFAMYISLPQARRYHLYLFPFSAGMLAKPPTMVFGPLLFFYILMIERQVTLRDAFRRRHWRTVRQVLRQTAPTFAATAVLLAAIEWMNPPTLNYGGAPFSQYLATQTWVWVRYVRLFFVPTGLTADTDLSVFTTWLDVRVVAGLLLLAACVGVAVRASASRELRPVAFGIIWFWITVLPASLFPLAEVTNDHRVFLPFMGLAAALSWSLALAAASLRGRSSAPRTVVVACAAAALGVLVTHAAATHFRNRVWRTEETLWADVVRKSPRNGRALMNYGLTQLRAGNFAVAKHYFDRAFERTPNYAVLHVNLGIIADALGDTADAESWFRRALRTSPELVDAYTFYSVWLTRRGRAPEAIPLLERATQLSPANVDPRNRLMELYAAAGDTVKLMRLAAQTLDVDPGNAVAQEMLTPARGGSRAAAESWHNQGLAHSRVNLHAAAAHAYRRAIAADSTYGPAWNNLGWSLAQLGFYTDAVVVLERAVSLQPHSSLVRNNLNSARSAAARLK